MNLPASSPAVVVAVPRMRVPRRLVIFAAVFGLPEERFHLVAPDVGGGFGLKNPLFPEYVLALWAARRLGRPVRWIAEASEEFASAVHARDAHAAVRLALDAEGRFLALDVAFTADMGAYLSAGGPGST